jgi:hypothetical protein
VHNSVVVVPETLFQIDHPAAADEPPPLIPVKETGLDDPSSKLGLLTIVDGKDVKITNVVPADVPPAVVTVTLAVPAVAIRLAGTAAVSWVALTKVVVSPAPFQFTVAPETKFVPVTVRVKAPPPAVAELGLRLVMVGSATPVPVRLAVCGLPVALSVMVTEAVRAPEDAGVKVTSMVQLAPAAKVAPQVLVWANSVFAEPVIAMLSRVTAVLPEFVRVSVWAVLVEPMAWFPNVSDDGASDSVAWTVCAGAKTMSTQ